MSIKLRLNRLLRETDVGRCECQRAPVEYVLVCPGEADPPADLCAICRRPKPRVLVNIGLSREMLDAL